MKINLPQAYFSKLMRAVVEFDLIADGDHILIGLSGGKDSLFLAYGLAVLRERLRKEFQLSALTIDPMFQADFDIGRLEAFCADLGIPHAFHKVDIAGAIRSQGGKKACFTCSYFRRGAVNRYAVEHGMNKVAYAHHLDDAVETFLMSILCSGQLATFLPKTELDRTGITVIRPLVYFREREMEEAVACHGCSPVKSPCPIDGKTQRQWAKELIASLGEEQKDLFAHLAAAMRWSAMGDLWPAAKTRDEMRDTYFKYMGKG